MLYFPIKRIVKIGSYLYKCQYSVSSLCFFQNNFLKTWKKVYGRGVLESVGRVTVNTTFFFRLRLSKNELLI